MLSAGRGDGYCQMDALRGRHHSGRQEVRPTAGGRDLELSRVMERVYGALHELLGSPFNGQVVEELPQALLRHVQ